ncbi:acyl--CoA ligase [Sedimentimonas flavescens]|uniref:Acyl--CoA ligase n=1 Tax=Sedimentimonas flavescens TaxID=2851012 RepID=A0ABT3A076_9RHOB|nr:class I adenylate-forming enzyme family protein [Sedimentimonas flavescens]MCV2879404.1 acyl--CoA ligase [Sedimentimonas flavescens]
MSLIDSFARAAARRPEKIALITERSQLSYSDILQLVQIFDMQLLTHGLCAGKTVVLLSARAEFILVMTLVASLRGYRLAFVASDLGEGCPLRPDLILVEQMRSDLETALQLQIAPDWFALMGTRPTPDYTGRGGDAQFVFGSSGSTGKRKLVQSSEASREETIRMTRSLPGVEMSQRRYLSTLSPRNGMAVTSNLAVLLAGGSVVSLEPQSPSLLPYIDLYRVDTIGSTPGMVAKLLGEENAAQYLEGVRDMRFGGALTSASLLRSLSEICPARLQVGYGAAEIGTCFNQIYDPANPPPEGYVGRPARADLVVAFFDDSGRMLPDANEGLIGLRLAGGSGRSYLEADPAMPGSTSGFIDGYFLPGDYMRRDGEDFFLIGRAKNIINFSGNKYALEAIQSQLATQAPHTSFAPLVDVGPDGLERLCLIYSGPQELPKPQVEAFFDHAFPGVQITRLLRLDSLPMTESGKIDMQALRIAHLG